MIPKSTPLISPKEIALIVEALSDKIAKDYETSPRLTLLIVLKGAFVFGADLLRSLDRRNIFCEVEFIDIKSYHGKVRGELSMEQIDFNKLRGKQVLIVEDIIDSGATVKALKEKLDSVCLNVKTCAFMGRRVDSGDYIGCVSSGFVIGYGMDYEGQYRGMNSINEI